MPGRDDNSASMLTWRPTRASRLGSAVLLGAGFGSIAYDNTFVQGHSPVEGLLLLAAVAVGWWPLAVRPAITLTPTEVVVRNPLRVRTIQLGDITDLRADVPGIRIQRRSGRAIYAWAVQKWNLSIWLDRSVRADDVVAAINRRVTVRQQHNE